MQAEVKISYSCACPHCGVRYVTMDNLPQAYTCLYGECLEKFEVIPPKLGSVGYVSSDSANFKLYNNFD